MERAKLFIIITGFAYLATACATNRDTGALVGAGAGAGLGAGIGALVGGGKGALIGGALGAATGAATGAIIGNYMDKQERELKKVKSANVQRQGDKLVVQFNSAILFDTGKSDLKAASQHDLTEFAGVLAKYPDTTVTVAGHTDNSGKKEKNVALSKGRADSVAQFLEGQGVTSGRVQTVGFADTQPIADNATPEGRQKNRRVEIHIEANEKLRQQQAAAGQQPQQ